MYMPKEKANKTKQGGKNHVEQRKHQRSRSQIFTYSAKVYGEPSEDYGIEGGKISKLEIRFGDFPVARYDRGWDIEPETENAQLALLAILHNFN
jgi:hypothetical protein